MLLLTLTITLVSLGIILTIKGVKNYSDGLFILGMFCSLVSVAALITMIVMLIIKPLDYTEFKIKYDTVENMTTNKDDIRDAAFTNNLLSINKTILTCRAYINNNWIGIFYNKNICDAELLSKRVEEDTNKDYQRKEDLYEESNNHIN